MGDLSIADVSQVGLGNSQEIKQKGAADFADVVKDAITEVNRLEKAADASIVDLIEGRATIGQIMVALQDADMGLVLAVRSEVIQSYREIMNMQF